MKERKSPKLWTVTALVVVISLVVPWAVFADVIQPDNDLVTTGNQQFVDLGNVSPGATLSPQVSFTLECAGNKHVDNGQLVTVNYTAAGSTVPAGGSMNATSATIGSIPVAWPDDGNNCPSPPPTPIVDNGNSTVTIAAPTVPGTYTYVAKYGNITLTPSGGNDPASVSGSVQVTFQLTVVSNTPPTLNLPASFTVEGNTIGGANVTYTVTATDAEDEPDPAPSCTPTSGSFFPLGTTTVNCAVTDSGGLTTTGSFDITVVDTTPPTLVGMPADMTVEGNTTGGANVTWTDPTATDIVDAYPTVGCTPASDSFFTLGGPHEVTCTATDASSNSSSDSFYVTVVDTTPPSIICPADFNGTVGQPVSLGSPTVSDIVDASPTVSNDAPGSFPPGSTFVQWTATDQSGNAASCTQKVTLLYNWTGFFQPVDNLPTINIAKAGSSIPVKFNLGGYQGLNIFQPGYPSVSLYTCGTVPGDEIETYTAGSSSLTYDFTAQQYVYVWKTEKSYAPKCGVLHVKLIDGTDHTANFKFK